MLGLKKRHSFAKIFALGATAVLAFALFGALARASITPTLSLNPTGDGDTVTVNVTGDPSQPVELFYIKSGYGSQIAFLGDTNASGVLSATVSSSADGIVTGTPVHVAVDGINGIVSQVMTWPTVSSSLTGAISLSQTSMVLTVGQSASATATNNTGTALYVSNNSNPSVANISVVGNQITAIGNAYGSTTVTVCSLSSTSNCPSLYVTVQNAGAQTLSFSQNTLTIASGQSVPITVSGGNGVYTILNNSNPSIISATVSGSIVTLSTSSTSGTASITVCSSDMQSCGIINATAGVTSTGVITFSQQYPTLTINQNMTVAIYGGSGTYYISSNTNPNAVQAYTSSSILTLTGLTTGSSTITVCSSTGGCGTITATTSYTSSGGSLTLSQTSLTLTSGQTLSITLSGGQAPYSLTVPSSSIYNASISGNVLSVTGLSSGSAQIAVCSSAGGCIWLSLQVNGSSVSTGSLSLGQSSLSLGIGQSSTISVYGSGSYYISSNTNTSVAIASISGSSILVNGTGNGTDTVVVCQTGGACSSLYITVGSSTTTSYGQGVLLAFGTPLETIGVGQSTIVPISGGSGSYYIAYSSNGSAVLATVSGSSLQLVGEQQNSVDIITVCSSQNSCGALPVAVGVVASTGVTTTTTTTVTGSASGDGYVFTQFLDLGTQGNEVAELQKRLGQLGYFNGSDTGYFGALTEQAVEAFQSAHGISPVGYVGPSTRAALNQY